MHNREYTRAINENRYQQAVVDMIIKDESLIPEVKVKAAKALAKGIKKQMGTSLKTAHKFVSEMVETQQWEDISTFPTTKRVRFSIFYLPRN